MRRRRRFAEAGPPRSAPGATARQRLPAPEPLWHRLSARPPAWPAPAAKPSGREAGKRRLQGCRAPAAAPSSSCAAGSTTRSRSLLEAAAPCR